MQYKFHEIPLIGYVVMAEDGNTDGCKDIQKDRWMNGQRQINIPPSLAGIIRTRITLAGLHVIFKILKV